MSSPEAPQFIPVPEISPESEEALLLRMGELVAKAESLISEGKIDEATKLVREAEELKDRLEGKTQAVPDNKETSTELRESTQEMTTYLAETFKSWYNLDDDKLKEIKWKPEIVPPGNINYTDKKDDIDQTKFGEYTLNPETKDINWDNIKPEQIKTVELPKELNGKTLAEVEEYLKTNYPKAKLPGLELWKYTYQNPSKFPQLKDGNFHFFSGSLFRRPSGRWCVPYVYVYVSGSSLDRNGRWLDSVWGGRCRLVLLDPVK